MSSTPALEPYLQHLRLTPASSSTRSVARTPSSPSPNPNSVIRRVAVASNPVLGARPPAQAAERTYINVQPAAIASRHGAVIRNPGSTTQWPGNRMMAATAGARAARSASAEGSGKQIAFSNQHVVQVRVIFASQRQPRP